MPARDRRIVRVFFALLAVVYFGVYPYLQAINNPNENTRTYLVMALADYGTWKLDPVVARFGWTNDMASVPDASAPSGTHLSAVKGPAMTYVGLPIYVVEKLVLRVFGVRRPDARSTPAEAASWLRVTTLTLELFCAHLPCFAFLVWFERRLRRVSGDLILRLSAVVAVGLGSNYLAYSFVFVSHATSSVAVFLALDLVVTERLLARGLPQRARASAAFLAGCAIGFVTLLEYQSLFLSVVLGLFALPIFRMPKTFAAFALGALPNVALLCLFQWASFGNALTPGHRWMQTESFRALQNQGLFGITLPHGEALRGLLFDGGYGLFPSTPFFLIALVSPLILLRGATTRVLRERCIRASVSFVLVTVLVLSISAAVMWRGGWTIGPRYLAAAPPLLALLALMTLERVARFGPVFRLAARSIASGLALASFAVGGAIGLVVSTLPESITRPLPQILLPFVRLAVVPHHALELFGVRAAWPFYVVLVVAIACALLPLALRGDDALRSRLGRSALALLVAAAFVVPLARLRAGDADDGPNVRSLLYAKWEPSGRDFLARDRARAEADPCAFAAVSQDETIFGRPREAEMAKLRGARCLQPK